MTKLKKDMKFDEILNKQVDMERVDLDSVKPWISKKITGLLKHEDEVLIDYVFNQLEPKGIYWQIINIMFPNPKEIQTNLSGFLSVTNARVFIAELWTQLLNSMGLDENGKSSNRKITSDKIKSFPRLGPSERKQSSNDIVRNESVEKKEFQHFMHNESGTESFSSEYVERDRSQSRSDYSSYSSDDRYKYQNRSGIKSSSRFSPYTRYSRYTNSYETNSFVDDSSSQDSFSSQSTSGSDLSKRSDLQNSIPKESYPENSKSNSSLVNLQVCNSLMLRELHEDNSEYRNNQNIDSNDSSDYSLKDIDSPHTQTQYGTSFSESVEFMSAEQEMSPRSDTSSSEYSIEYVDKSLMNQFTKSKSEDLSEEEIVWITNEEYQQMLDDNKSMFSETHNSSPSNSYNSSEYSFNDIEWVEKYELDHYLSSNYLQI